jgi:hypothetical protein
MLLGLDGWERMSMYRAAMYVRSRSINVAMRVRSIADNLATAGMPIGLQDGLRALLEAPFEEDEDVPRPPRPDLELTMAVVTKLDELALEDSSVRAALITQYEARRSDRT